MTEVRQMVWRDAESFKPYNTDKVLCITKTKKGVLNCVMGYYDPELGWVCGMNSNVIAWTYVDMPEWVK